MEFDMLLPLLFTQNTVKIHVDHVDILEIVEILEIILKTLVFYHI